MGFGRAAWVGVALWLVRPAYLAAEVVVAAATTGGYSFRDDTVSDLGAVTCTAAYCSPRHALMNGSFVGFGLLLALGAVLLAPYVGRWVAGLLVVAGLSSVAVGLTPLDAEPGLHVLAATPLFVAQPIALVLLGAHLGGRCGRFVSATGAVCAVGAIGFVVVGEGTGAGALERLALWPVLVVPALAAVVALRRGSRSG